MLSRKLQTLVWNLRENIQLIFLQLLDLILGCSFLFFFKMGKITIDSPPVKGQVVTPDKLKYDVEIKPMAHMGTGSSGTVRQIEIKFLNGEKEDLADLVLKSVTSVTNEEHILELIGKKDPPNLSKLLYTFSREKKEENIKKELIFKNSGVNLKAFLSKSTVSAQTLTVIYFQLAKAIDQLQGLKNISP